MDDQDTWDQEMEGEPLDAVDDYDPEEEEEYGSQKD